MDEIGRDIRNRRRSSARQAGGGFAVPPAAWPHGREAGRIRRGVAWALLGIGLLALAACGESVLGEDPDTGLSALVLRGPIQPVMGEGEPNEAPVAAATVRVRSVDGRGAAAVTTDADGRARISLRPGRYAVAVTSCPGALGLPAEIEVDIEAGELAERTLICDTGIR